MYWMYFKISTFKDLEVHVFKYFITGNKYKYIVNLQFIKLALKQKLSTLIVYNMFTCETYLIKKYVLNRTTIILRTNSIN